MNLINGVDWVLWVKIMRLESTIDFWFKKMIYIKSFQNRMDIHIWVNIILHINYYHGLS